MKNPTHITFKYVEIEKAEITKERISSPIWHNTKTNLIKINEEIYKKYDKKDLKNIVAHEIFHKNIKGLYNIIHLLFGLLSLVALLLGHWLFLISFLICIYLIDVSIEFSADAYACDLIGAKNFFESLKKIDKNEGYNFKRWVFHPPFLRYWLIKRRL